MLQESGVNIKFNTSQCFTIASKIYLSQAFAFFLYCTTASNIHISKAAYVTNSKTLFDCPAVKIMVNNRHVPSGIGKLFMAGG